MNRKRIGALLLCIGLALILSVSTALIAHEADHDCTGEDCPICLIIAVSIRLLRTTGLALAALPVFFPFPVSNAAYGRRNEKPCFCPGTLVSWKIRLND